MPDTIVKLITPGPLNLPVRFQARILSCWFTSGIVVGFLWILVLALSGGSSALDFFTVLGFPFTIALVYCVYGLIGVGIDKARGIPTIHKGWYWYIYPALTILWLVFLIFLFILPFIFGFSGSKSSGGNRSPRRPRISEPQLRDGLEGLTAKEFLEEYLEEIESLENRNELTEKHKKVIKKIRSLDKDALRSDLADCLKDDEMEELIGLIIILLKLLGVTVY